MYAQQLEVNRVRYYSTVRHRTDVVYIVKNTHDVRTRTMSHPANPFGDGQREEPVARQELSCRALEAVRKNDIDDSSNRQRQQSRTGRHN